MGTEWGAVVFVAVWFGLAALFAWGWSRFAARRKRIEQHIDATRPRHLADADRLERGEQL